MQQKVASERRNLRRRSKPKTKPGVFDDAEHEACVQGGHGSREVPIKERSNGVGTGTIRT